VLLSRTLGLALIALGLVDGAAAQQSQNGGHQSPVVPNVTGPTLGEAGRGFVGVQLGYFYAEDGPGNGNPYLDEELTVIEPVLVFDYNVSDRTAIGGSLSYDHVTSASIDRLSNFPDQSGASGDNYIGVDLGLRHMMDSEWILGGRIGGSVEYDYTSISLGFNATQPLASGDASVTYSFDAFFDTLDVIRFNGVEEGSDDRTSLNAAVQWYQIFSPRRHGTFGVTLTQQNGFLETPYNAVVVLDPLLPPNPNLDNMARGVERTEELPSDRFRLAAYGRVRTSIDQRRAWELGGRLYGDTWGVNSLTVEPRYYWAAIPGKLDWRFRYRFYTQTEADDFGEEFFTDFTGPEQLRTQDSDLGAFNAHTLGMKWTWFLKHQDTFHIGIDYTLRSDGLDYYFANTGWTWSF